MVKTVAPALKALLEHFIDYAGIFPPAALPLDQTVSNFNQYAKGEYLWMLRYVVVGEKELAHVPASLDGKLSILTDADNVRAAAIETKNIVKAAHPVYCEVTPGDGAMLDAVKAAGCYAKIRTGAMTPEGIPDVEQVARFIVDCAERRLPFKATAGLHHPVRALYPLTYAEDAPRAVMHGFLNVLMAAAFAWQGETDIEQVLADVQPAAFTFDDNAYWRDKELTLAEIKDMRANFMHAIGSCSFEEPVDELQKLGLLD
ncbi:MAG: hypothetical protein IPP57_02590 [Candidatus Obscuribacter sp.]|nr:hypothetical protein [Candidatus Obscuribacter sp.]MBK9618892.1 hypothetical protein [Candidatus Obscuribacter sp.]MBK9769714.1 hypothetical protein [Candidatus Obscuribacter sp.]